MIETPARATPNRSNSWSARLLPWARGVVLVLILFSIGTLLLGIALFPGSAAAGLASVVVPNTKWSLDTTQAAIGQLGWTLQALSWLYAILGWLTAAAYCAVGLLVFVRRRDDWFDLYVAIMFAVLGTSGGLTREMFVQAGPVLKAWQGLTSLLSWQLLFILFYLFPDGRFVPSWTRWLLLGWVGVNVLGALAPGLDGVTTPITALLVLSTMGSQIYRYFRKSDPVQRAQAERCSPFTRSGSGRMSPACRSRWSTKVCRSPTYRSPSAGPAGPMMHATASCWSAMVASSRQRSRSLKGIARDRQACLGKGLRENGALVLWHACREAASAGAAGHA
jgi:hypothetical protein